jgi:hypothetical protein
VAIILSYGTARILLAGEAEVREEYMASGSYTSPGARGLSVWHHTSGRYRIENKGARTDEHLSH